MPRSALVQRLIGTSETPLVLIVAPPGYGKSTLLAEWEARDERTFIRIELRENDDHESALRRIRRSAPQRGQSVVLKLDDAHAAPPRLLGSVIPELLERLPPGSQVALASRTELPLPTGQLRAHRALVEIRPGDLALSPAEAAALVRLAGVELDFGSVQALVRATEGWPVGLYLAALSMRGQDEVESWLAGFGGDNHLVSEYFRDVFLGELSPKIRNFLITTSVLDELCGPLCDAVLAQRGSAETLAEVARRNLMLVAVDQTHERFRWHSLFRIMLRGELRRTQPELEPELHLRASAWLRDRGDVDGAISHASAAGEVTVAGDLLWANAARYLGSGRNDMLQQWLAPFSIEQIADYAPMALVAAHSALLEGDVEQARRWGSLASAAKRQVATAKALPSIEAGIAIIDAATVRTGAIQMAETATHAYQLEPEHGPSRPLCCLLLGIAEHLAGHRESAKLRLEEGVALSTSGAPSVASLCLAQLVLMAIEQDDWGSAAEFADRAMQIIEQHPALATYPISAMVFAASAASGAREGRVDDAKRCLRHSTRLLNALDEFIPWYAAETRIMLAQAALGLADMAQARSLLAEASRFARKTPGAVIFQPCLDEAWAQIDTLAETALTGTASLTIAELRILRFLPSHRSFREIADRLGVSVNTVKTQAHAIYRKLDAESRSEAVARAANAGLLGT